MPMLDFSTFSVYLSNAVTVWKRMDNYKDIFSPEWICGMSLIDDVVELLGGLRRKLGRHNGLRRRRPPLRPQNPAGALRLLSEGVQLR